MKNTLRIERAVLNITQAALAEKVKVSRQTINAIESNKYVPSTILALKIARVFQKNWKTSLYWSRKIKSLSKNRKAPSINQFADIQTI